MGPAPIRAHRRVQCGSGAVEGQGKKSWSRRSGVTVRHDEKRSATGVKDYAGAVIRRVRSRSATQMAFVVYGTVRERPPEWTRETDVGGVSANAKFAGPVVIPQRRDDGASIACSPPMHSATCSTSTRAPIPMWLNDLAPAGPPHPASRAFDVPVVSTFLEFHRSFLSGTWTEVCQIMLLWWH